MSTLGIVMTVIGATMIAEGIVAALYIATAAGDGRAAIIALAAWAALTAVWWMVTRDFYAHGWKRGCVSLAAVVAGIALAEFTRRRKARMDAEAAAWMRPKVQHYKP